MIVVNVFELVGTSIVLFWTSLEYFCIGLHRAPLCRFDWSDYEIEIHFLKISTIQIVLKYPFVLPSFWWSGFYVCVDLTSMTYVF